MMIKTFFPLQLYMPKIQNTSAQRHAKIKPETVCEVKSVTITVNIPKTHGFLSYTNHNGF